MAESKECRECHRVGYRGFVASGDYGWVCSRDDVCRKRKAEREKQDVEERWSVGVDWLLNHRDSVDTAPLFWAYQDGIITLRELRDEAVNEEDPKGDPVSIYDAIDQRRAAAEHEGV